MSTLAEKLKEEFYESYNAQLQTGRYTSSQVIEESLRHILEGESFLLLLNSVRNLNNFALGLEKSLNPEDDSCCDVCGSPGERYCEDCANVLGDCCCEIDEEDSCPECDGLKNECSCRFSVWRVTHTDACVTQLYDYPHLIEEVHRLWQRAFLL